MHPNLFFLLSLILTPIYIPFMVLFAFIPKDNVTQILKTFSLLFTPLRIILLTPGAIKSHLVSKTFWFRPKTTGERAVLVLGGNAMTPFEAYDCIHSYLVDNKIDDFDCACIPLQTKFTQEEYLDYLVDVCKSEFLDSKKTLYICGHSLGGALAIQLAKKLLVESPTININLFLSRTFNKLWDVSKFKYGEIIGGYFEKIFSGLWQLDSQKDFDLLDRERIKVIVEDVNPDEVLGPAQLKVHNSQDKLLRYSMSSGESISPELVHSVSQAHLKSLKKRHKLTPHT